MDIFNALTLTGGLSLFLFGMSIMGQALERRAGGKLRALLGKFTTGRAAGLLTGLVVTAVIQSSSATTVMVVGFVNSGLMTLRQAVNVIMGANVGTTVTAWILSLAGIDSGSWYIRLAKPSSFTPLLALAGIILYMFCRGEKKKDTGMIFLGFATLMFGMETMSGAVSGLREVPAFRELFVMFENPLLGVLAGAALTAIIQSSSASVGILQALAVTGQVSYGAAIPIIMGQNIGTCVTAMLSSVGANKNAKRAAMVHLSFNCIGTAVWISVFSVARGIFHLHFLEEPASLLGIAVAHSVFNVLCLLLILPLSDVLEKLVTKMVPDVRRKEEYMELDERLFAAPSIALERCHRVTGSMAQMSVASLKEAIDALGNLTPELAAAIRLKEEKTDYYEDVLSTYLVKLSALQISAADSTEAAKLLKTIGDFERISDHAVNLLGAAEEMAQKERSFSPAARRELEVLCGAVAEILDLSLEAFLEQNLEAAAAVEPLEQVIDRLKEQMRTRHILRMQQGGCSITAGFVWSDMLTDLERTADHCSNIAGCMLDMALQDMSLHEHLRKFRDGSEEFGRRFREYEEKYALPEV
ncbi:Na/Pi cotransporter family protein [uncultured Acetatifactor sp.]|uniref:Na/Pi cotransporter family protein n=1 Tax=uncultured Acetatifactor sp. TaxID=1671927 RepID=UPI00261F48C7|nr:Na/Pi cotransporter family protein [uncultured Acetatifactor sp.]